MNTFRRMLSARRDAVMNNDKGFTLVELIVVIVIIGILAAIAIPVFIGQQASANAAAAESNVANGKIAMSSWIAAQRPALATTTAVTATGAGLADYGWPGASVSVSGTVASYCISSSVGGQNRSMLSTSGTIFQTLTCA